MTANERGTDTHVNGRAVEPALGLLPKPRVLIWGDSDQFAGTERHCCELERGLRRMGIPVQVACPHPSPMSSEVLGIGGTVVPLKSKGFAAISALWRVFLMLRQKRVEIIHAHNGKVALLGALSCWLANRGVLIVSQHFIAPARVSRNRFLKPLAAFVHRWIASRVTRWIAVSKAVSEAMVARGDVQSRAVQVVWNGVGKSNAKAGSGLRTDFGRVLPVSPLPKMVCVARLATEKGHRTLLHALAILMAEHCRFVLWIVGDGERRQELEDLCEELLLRGSVQFVGHQRNPEAWISAADLLVLPSPEEPFGLVLLEAMSLGKAVVAARSGGPPEVIEDERSGLLFNAGDPRDLAMKLRVLLERKALREAMGKAGNARWSAYFTPERMSQETYEVYQAALTFKG